MSMCTRSTALSRLSIKDNTSLVLLSLARFCIPLCLPLAFLRLEICRSFGRAYIKSCRQIQAQAHARTHVQTMVYMYKRTDLYAPRRQLSKSLRKHTHIFNVHFGEYENRFFFFYVYTDFEGLFGFCLGAASLVLSMLGFIVIVNDVCFVKNIQNK